MTERDGNGSDALVANAQSEPVLVLLIADQPAVGDRAAAAIEGHADRFAVTRVDTAAEGLDAVGAEAVDCVVSGYDLPDTDGVEFLRAVRDRDGDLPFVLFTARGSEAVASEAIAAGVDEYLPATGDDSAAALASGVECAVSRSQAERQVTEHLDRMTDAFCGIDESWRLTYLNGQATRLLERDAEDLLGDRVWDLFPALRGTEVESRLREAVETGEQTTFEYRFDALGRDFSIDAYPSETGLSVYFRDVTEKRGRQRELERTSARLEALYEDSPDMIDIHDEGGEIVDANSVMAVKLGYNREAIVGMDVWEIDAELDPTEGVELWQSLKMGETRRLETTFRRADGTTFPVEVQVRRVDVQGEDRFLASSRDISERKAYERRIERENERLDEFASIVSHDLRNPLNVLSGYLRLARETGEESYFDRCDTALDEMERLIDDVLTLARQGDAVGSADPVSLGELATRYANDAFGSTEADGGDVADGEAGESNASPTVAVETDRDVLADPGRLERLLQNLFRNAAEHGGDRVVVGDLSEGFYVEDDGPGIPEDRRDEVFESGATTSASGTGLGLAIVERVAEAHGWEVTLTEGEDGGARFEFTGVEQP